MAMYRVPDDVGETERRHDCGFIEASLARESNPSPATFRASLA
jgi:hypothetical protein